MSDDLPALSLDFGEGRAPVVLVDDRELHPSLAGLLAAVPQLADPDRAAALARVVNHLARGLTYEVIRDPDAFRAAYMARLDAEDPEEAVPPGVIRLRGFGIPDFAAIRAPAHEGGTLVFFARNRSLGIPYRVTLPPGGAAVYDPVPMTG